MANRNLDFEQKYKEDLERAQALSLESLALEEFKNKKLLELHKSSKVKNVTVNRTASMNETDSAKVKYDCQQSKSRPRPGTSVGNVSNSLIAPPPTSHRKNSNTSIDESPDLISFSSPPPKTSNIMNLANLQNYNNNLDNYSPRTVIQQPQYYSHIPAAALNVNNTPMMSIHQPWFKSSYPDLGMNQAVKFMNVIPQTTHISLSPVRFPNKPNPPTVKPDYRVPNIFEHPVPPVLPPKNHQRTPPPIYQPSSSSSLKRQEHKIISQNLIDLAPTNSLDRNSVRVSILQEFDPILCANDFSVPLRTISPECTGDDAMSVCDSVYDEYDPYDFINTGSGNNNISDPMYSAIIRSGSAPQSPVPSQVRMSTIERNRGSISNTVKCNLMDSIDRVDRSVIYSQDSDLTAFYKMVQNVRNKYQYNDPDTNMGFIISPMVNYQYKEGTSIKLSIYPDFEGADFDKPFSFTCDVTSSIEHITLQSTYGLEAPSTHQYTLKVWGCNEYLAPTSFLSDYEYVHNCIKLDEDVLLIMIPDIQVDKSFARTLNDDKRDQNLSFEEVIPVDLMSHITFDDLKIVLEFLENEIKSLQEQALQIESCKDPTKLPEFQPRKVIQSVKCVVNLMNNLCTLEIMEAIDTLETNCKHFIPNIPKSTFSRDIERSCGDIKISVLNLIDMYCSAFNVNFKLKNSTISNGPTLTISDISLPLALRICALYRPYVDWKHDYYLVAVQVYHGTKPIKNPKLSLPCVKTEDHWPTRIVFNHGITLDEVPISSLARESRLVIVIYGRTEEPPESGDNSNVLKYKQEEIGWASVQLINYEGVMVQGNMLLSIWPKETNYMYGPAPGTNWDSAHPLLELEIDNSGSVIFPSITHAPSITKGDFNSLDSQTQQQLIDVSEQDMLFKLPPETREVLWEKRHYLYDIPNSLPKVLLAAHSWEYSCLKDLHGMLYAWKPLKPIQSLQLLLPTFPDTEVRKLAVKWISALSTDALVDYLPQLVVALRHETYEHSSLAEFLLDRSLRSPRFAHYLFWLLCHNLPGPLPQNFVPESNNKDCINIPDARYFRRTKLLLRALLAICGESLRNCFLSQQILVKELNDIAEIIQKTKDSQKLVKLHHSLEEVNNNLQGNHTSLPLSPTLRVAGINVDKCFYFASNTLPLKIDFVTPDLPRSRSVIIPAIYKIGDDLQQDMLTIQMVRIMDKLWLNKGLDLKMVSFTCTPTGTRKGMIELVKQAETLRKIQVEHGLTGSFKDKPIAEWLAKHNPSELEYGRAVQNFTASCAGYCVVTYILGICDRHNDNIMLKTSGHLFHIDFGKFLGDAQMFGNFKRDRAPFVLTSDMAYVINGGDRPSAKFHQFVDLCCQAFNIVRSNGNLFLYIFTLMMSSGIGGVTTESVNYLHNALLPGVSNPEAAAYFARLIESSLKSWFTQFNFFLHNLAQLKFSAEHNDGSLLSFVPKVYSQETDGQLKHVQVVKYKKRYDPDKYYVYILRVFREEDNGPPMEIQRTFKEFCELHQKLCICFPLSKLHSLSTGLHVGRSNIKQVAEKRFHEICLFIKSLFMCAQEIAHSKLVYTFFHPLLRDQQFQEEFYRKSKDRGPSSRSESGILKGQLKLSLQFSKGVFSVMVHHVRGLPLLPNGQEPSTYVKVYLHPDDNKATKRKTKVVKRNCHPSFMEMLEYRMALERIQQRSLKATVWNYDALQENEFLGGVELELSQFDLTSEITEWYPLVNLNK